MIEVLLTNSDYFSKSSNLSSGIVRSGLLALDNFFHLRSQLLEIVHDLSLLNITTIKHKIFSRESSFLDKGDLVNLSWLALTLNIFNPCKSKVFIEVVGGC